jgi:hypothetical protein
MRRALDHAPATAAWAEPTALARERYEPIEAAASAPESREATGQRPAGHVRAELALHERREPAAVGSRGCTGAERLEVIDDDGAQDVALGRATAGARGVPAFRTTIRTNE